jgi:polysaccharide export outer membrane protein
MKIKIVFFSLLAILLYSCQSTPKNVAYFQNLSEYVKQNHEDEYYKYEPIIKISDQLLITVSSPTLHQEIVAQFNLPVNSFLASGETLVAQTGNLQTYTVDTEGYIIFPVLGRIKMSDKTKSQAITYLTDMISKYAEEAIVNVQIVSFRVMVLGEVSRPGPVSARNERLTILEAIDMAGDLTIYGQRENVLLVREIDGKKEFARLDLTKAEIFSSPYYYLQQNDAIYVEANDARKRASKFGAAESYNMSIISLSFSALSVIASTAIAIYSLTKK